jgi:TRAP-type C4-dicarboxylate transport system permease small subunit
MNSFVQVWKRFAETLVVVIFGVMFIGFIVQIVSRYVFNSPVAWSLEVCLIAYLWVVFWTCDVLINERQHIVFDVLYNLAKPTRKRRLAIFTSGSLAVVFLIAIPSTFDYIQFLSRRRSMSLHVPMQLVYGCFLVFVIAVVVSALIRLWRLLRPGWEQHL